MIGKKSISAAASIMFRKAGDTKGSAVIMKVVISWAATIPKTFLIKPCLSLSS